MYRFAKSTSANHHTFLTILEKVLISAQMSYIKTFIINELENVNPHKVHFDES